jgi:hypothetical protein
MLQRGSCYFYSTAECKLLPTLDNLRNFLLTPTKEMLSFLQQLTSVPMQNRTTAGYV